MMRAILLGLLVAGVFSLPSYAAEPDGPAEPDQAKEASAHRRASRLAAKAGGPAASKAQKDALIEYYLVPDQPCSGSMRTASPSAPSRSWRRSAKADDYGLPPPITRLPNPAGFNASDPKARDWLADAEVKVSYAVLDYAKDARGGRIEPLRLSKNLDPALALPNPSEVLDTIAIRSDAAAYLRSFQPDQPQFEALRMKLLELRGGKARSRSQAW